MKRKLELNVRKKPVQRRSKDLNKYILQAATRVLQKFGANGFTTNKVAEETGISIGSFYQYFPNKESLLFQLHKLETERTLEVIEKILNETEKTSKVRIYEVVRYFFKSEIDESELRKSLNSAAIFFQKTEEFKVVEDALIQRFKEFLSEFLNADEENLNVKTDVAVTLLKSLGEEISTRNLSDDELEKWTQICCKMLFHYLEI
jgi:AcrR family transcriptional regulator